MGFQRAPPHPTPTDLVPGWGPSVPDSCLGGQGWGWISTLVFPDRRELVTSQAISGFGVQSDPEEVKATIPMAGGQTHQRLLENPRTI